VLYGKKGDGEGQLGGKKKTATRSSARQRGEAAGDEVRNEKFREMIVGYDLKGFDSMGKKQRKLVRNSTK